MNFDNVVDEFDSNVWAIKNIDRDVIVFQFKENINIEFVVIDLDRGYVVNNGYNKDGVVTRHFKTPFNQDEINYVASVSEFITSNIVIPEKGRLMCALCDNKPFEERFFEHFQNHHHFPMTKSANKT